MARPRAGKSHIITLSDSHQRWGITMSGTGVSMREQPIEPNNLFMPGRTSGRYGDFDPNHAHVEQRDWLGGRAGDTFIDDNTKYNDSRSAWTLTEGRLIPVPEALPAFGINGTLADATLLEPVTNLPTGARSWIQLWGTSLYAKAVWTQATTGGVGKPMLWIRRRGQPTGDFHIGVRKVGLPFLDTDVLTTGQQYDTPMETRRFDLSTASYNASQDYELVVYGNATDDSQNHWEVLAATSANGISGWVSADDVTYSSFAPICFYYDMFDISNARHMYFEYLGALYAFQIYPAAGSTRSTGSHLYINGDRGKDTSSSSNTISDSNKTWVTDKWVDAFVKITAGKGSGQTRKISNNSATQLTVTLNWDVTPDTTSEYVIYGTPWWTRVATSATYVDKVTDVLAVNGVVYAAMGESTTIKRMRWNPAAATPTHEYADDGANKATYLALLSTPADGPQVWRGNNLALKAQISRADTQDWGTNLKFKTPITVSGKANLINNLMVHDKQLYVFMQHGIFIQNSDKIYPVNSGLGDLISDNNGVAALSVGSFLYYSWMHTLMRTFGTTTDDVGPWKGTGLPEGRNGRIVKAIQFLSWVFVVMDAGADGTSSVLAYNTQGWHELFRAPIAGYSIRDIYVQDNPGGRPRLWIDFSGSWMFYIDFAKDAVHPLRDSGLFYEPEFYLVTGTFDFGAPRLLKIFSEYTVITENLANTGGNFIYLDYQLDDEIGTNFWTSFGTVYSSPASEIPIKRGNKHQIRLRLRVQSEANIPPIILSTVLEGVARTPVRTMISFRAKVSDLQLTPLGTKDADPDEFLDWLNLKSRSMEQLYLQAPTLPNIDGMIVVGMPPSPTRSFINQILNLWGGYIEFSVREA